MKAFIIHNPEYVQSVELAQKSMRSCITHGMPAEVVSGVPKDQARLIASQLGYNVNGFDYVETQRVRPLRDGQIGCFLAHRDQWIRCIKLNEPIMVLEHDAALVAPFQLKKPFRHVLNLQRVIWDDPNWPWHAKAQRVFVDNLKENGNAKYMVLSGTCAYAITPEGAHRLLHSSMNMLPVDLFTNKTVVDIDDHAENIIKVANDFSLVAP